MADSVSNKWIVKYHDEWTKATLNRFFQECQTEEITNEQFVRWLVDRVIIAKRMITFVDRISERIGCDPLPCKDYVRQDYDWLIERVADFRLGSGLSMSYACQNIIESVDKAVAPENPICVPLTALWTFLFAAEQGWRLGSNSVGRKMSKFATFQKFLARDTAVIALIETQSILEEHLASAGKENVIRCQETFEITLRRLNALMEEAILARKIPGMKELCEKCGRQGHREERCTFKHHI